MLSILGNYLNTEKITVWLDMGIPWVHVSYWQLINIRTKDFQLYKTNLKVWWWFHPKRVWLLTGTSHRVTLIIYLGIELVTTADIYIPKSLLGLHFLLVEIDTIPSFTRADYTPRVFGKFKSRLKETWIELIIYLIFLFIWLSALLTQSAVSWKHVNSILKQVKLANL